MENEEEDTFDPFTDRKPEPDARLIDLRFVEYIVEISTREHAGKDEKGQDTYKISPPFTRFTITEPHKKPKGKKAPGALVIFAIPI